MAQLRPRVRGTTESAAGGAGAGLAGERPIGGPNRLAGAEIAPIAVPL